MGIGSSIGSVAGAGIGMLGGLFGKSSNSRAANSMSQGNLMAALIQQQMFAQASQNYSPFLQYGQKNMTALQDLLGLGPGGDPTKGYLTSRFNPTMAQLEQTPGYQFTKQQGLKALDNQFAATGLGNSGNAMRGAADYVTGLASNTYQQQFQNYWGENQNIFNMLNQGTQTGLNAANGLMTGATNFANMIGQDFTNAGNARAGGIMGGYNSMMSGLGNAVGMSNYFNNNNTFGGLGNSLQSGLSALTTPFWSPFPSSYS